MLIAFPVQQWLHESVTILHYTYFDCLVLTPVDLMVIQSFPQYN
jgi:hypothetical protein